MGLELSVDFGSGFGVGDVDCLGYGDFAFAFLRGVSEQVLAEGSVCAYGEIRARGPGGVGVVVQDEKVLELVVGVPAVDVRVTNLLDEEGDDGFFALSQGHALFGVDGVVGSRRRAQGRQVAEALGEVVCAVVYGLVDHAVSELIGSHAIIK